MCKQFLNVVYKDKPIRIDIKDMKRLSDLQNEIEQSYSKLFPEVITLRVQLWNKNTSPPTEFDDLDDINDLPEQYFVKEDGLCLTVRLLPISSFTRIEQVAAQKHLVSDQSISDQIKKRRLCISNQLVGTVGADFVFSDRNHSFKVLADALQERYLSWNQGHQDRNLYPIPFLADGPGTGKSRFLQELPTLFVNFVSQGSYSKEFKNAFKSPVFINIIFGNGCDYSPNEAESISIEQSLCLRILYQFESGYSSFSSFYYFFKHQEFSLLNVLEKVTNDASCIILGIDGVKQVHDEEALVNKPLIYKLIQLVGSLSCNYSPFFVPILSSTVMGPIYSAISYSRHPPLHIPLPLLSFESCLNIFEKKNAKLSLLVHTNHQLRQLISDCGGHGRTLEILYQSVLGFYRADVNLIDWKGVIDQVCSVLDGRYLISNIPLATAIASSILLLDVWAEDIYPEKEKMTFQNLQEKGLIQLDRGQVRISHFFTCCFLLKSGKSLFTTLWRDLLIGRKDYSNFWWKDWEMFNRNYISFRLSLYAYLKYTTVSLQEFFGGAKMNISEDIHIKVPLFENLKISKADYRYPTTQAPDIDIGDHVLNGDEAPFDSFLYLETTTNDRVLFAFQMKLANQDSIQVISNKIVSEEFNKVSNSVTQHLPGTEFICVILSFRQGTFDSLPSNCIVVSKEDHFNFYGPSYHQRLNNIGFS